MIIIRIDFKKKHLISQTDQEIIAEVNSGSTYNYRKRWTATPSVEDFAKLHPEQTVKVSFCSEDVCDELIRLTEALELGGYRHGAFSPLLHKELLAVEALAFDLHEIAFEDLEIEDHDYTYEETSAEATGEDALIVTLAFRTKKDAERFKSHVRLLNFRVVEDDTRLD